LKTIRTDFNKELFNKCFAKLCHLNSYLFYENKIDGFIKSKLNPYEVTTLNFFSLWTNSLLEIAIENGLYNQYMIDQFILLFKIHLAHGKKNILHEYKLLGRYNFDEIMKNGSSDTILESYFYILSQMSEHITNLLSKFKSKPIVFTKPEKITNDYKTYQVYKTFFNNFNQQIINEPSDCYSLFYKEEVSIKDNSYYMLRFNNAVDNNVLVSNISGIY
jgi:hypothetical protein